MREKHYNYRNIRTLFLKFSLFDACTMFRFIIFLGISRWFYIFTIILHPSPFPLGLYDYTCMSYCDVHLAPAIELYCITLSVQIEETSWLVSLCPGMLLGDGLPVHYITPTSNICLFIAQIVRGDNWCVSGQQTFLCQLYETASIHRLKGFARVASIETATFMHKEPCSMTVCNEGHNLCW